MTTLPFSRTSLPHHRPPFPLATATRTPPQADAAYPPPLPPGPCPWCGLDHPNGVPAHLTAAGHPYRVGRDAPATIATIGGQRVEL